MTPETPAKAELSDLVWVRAQRGDREAFRALVERHSAAVYRLAYRITQEAAVAEDVVQETFLKVFQQLASFDGRSKFSTWLHRIAANLAVDAVRRRQRRHQTFEPGLDEDAAADPAVYASPDPDPLRHLESSEIARATEAALGDLSALERAAFVLRHFQGCSIDEVSQTLGTREAASKQAIFRAVGKLRRALAPWMAPSLQEIP